MKNAFMILAVLIVALASAPTKAAEGNDGVHVIPSRSGDGKSELRPGQFRRGTKFFEEPKGWVDSDPCWRHTQSTIQIGKMPSDKRDVWEFVCD
jgi:hypothetical protein